ncbi:DUF3231 family protein [Litchfieldia salsa]|uniref:DUF3231 family protein n=1 Tax=Litchfieldia salsa TaxID=930152 RepID=A0A1H0P8F1_9BACI|nr:DUF3231 family protein [Litchfieldia salsa]SDP01342.1 Protein of unknown function [Litchfieldia salsa]
MNDVKLSTSEIAHLWTTYMNDTLAYTVLPHFSQNVEDEKTKELLEFALSTSQEHLKFLTSLFEQTQFPIPTGFTKNDVSQTAPRLYSDVFYLCYLKNMSFIGGNGYSLALGNSARQDVRKFFMGAIDKSAQLYDRSAEVMLEKGVFLRPSQINFPDKVGFVDKQTFLSGWFGDRRPLTSIEVMNLTFNIERNELGRSLLTGFQQVAKSKAVKDFLSKGIKIASKHVEIFGSILSESGLPTPMIWNTLPTESTEYTFSDKLIMFHSAALTAASTSHYGTSLGSSPRRDIGLHYTRLILEVTKFGEDGANIMIDNGWLEQPPSASDREALKNKNLSK